MLHIPDDLGPPTPPCEPEVRQIFRASTTWNLGDNNTCRFCSARWLDGHSIAKLMPDLANLGILESQCKFYYV